MEVGRKFAVAPGARERDLGGAIRTRADVERRGGGIAQAAVLL